MQVDINGMRLEFTKTHYNKSKVQEDGITYIIDTEHSYPLYQFRMSKNYFDIDNKNDLLKLLINDLRNTTNELEKQIDREKDSKEVEK